MTEILEDKAKKNIVENFKMAAIEFDVCFISPYQTEDNEQYCFLDIYVRIIWIRV